MTQEHNDDAKEVLTTGHGDHDKDRRWPDGRGAAEGGGTLSGGVSDDLEDGTTGATSMTGGDRSEPGSGVPGNDQNEARPGGRTGGASEEELGPIGIQSASGSPAGQSGGGVERGPAAEGSFASATYNDRGNVTGPDSPAGADAQIEAGDQAQGDDLANRLGGEEGRGTGMSGAGTVTGDRSAGSSEASDDGPERAAAGAIGTDAGNPGGMGGARSQGADTGGHPPGGVSPMRAEQKDE